jgi:hypothetical protein
MHGRAAELIDRTSDYVETVSYSLGDDIERQGERSR